MRLSLDCKVRVFWIVGLFAAVSCSDDNSSTSQGGLNQPCFPDNTCQAGLVCNTMTKTCSAQQTLGVGGQGEPCFPNGSCRTGLTCAVDVCTTGQTSLPGTLGQPCRPDGSCDSDLTCHPTTKYCVTSGTSSSCPGPCGAHATCTTTTCTCDPGYDDCNGDKGKVGTNGCECKGSCSGTTCSGMTIECEENILNDCGEATKYCADGKCTECAEGSFNCDAVGDCEATADCAADGCERIFAAKQCVRQSQYCDATNRCVDCPDGMLNCSRAGESCDCTTSCDGSFCKAECAADVGCSNPAKWCDTRKCVDCPAGRQNCNGSGACECQGTCNGTQCTGTLLCDHYDQNVCGGDQGQWCYENKCYPCTDEASSGFNCNGTMGCECDSAGCNGTQCKGKCTGGECP